MENTDLINDRLKSIVNRDRIESLFKEFQKYKSGCFYLGLIAAWYHLNPGKIIDRKFSELAIKSSKEGFGVDASEFIEQVDNLSGYLGLRVSRVEILKDVVQTEEEIRKEFHFPEDLEISRNDGISFLAKTGETGLVFWQHIGQDAGAHYSSLNKSPELLGMGLDSDGEFGGQSEANYLISIGSTPTLCFFLTKK